MKGSCDGCGLIKFVRWFDEENAPDGLEVGAYCHGCLIDNMEQT